MSAQIRAHVSVNARAIDRAKKRIEDHAAKADPKRLTVGIHQAEGEHRKLDYDGNDADVSLVEVAAAHEFGANVPERSWLRTWFDQNRARLIHEMVIAGREQYAGNKSAIERQGESWAIQLQEWIEYQDAGLKALKPSTVDAKERAGLASPETPLFATGQIVAAIKSMIDEGSK